jgi:hypothetical protein
MKLHDGARQRGHQVIGEATGVEQMPDARADL